MAPSDETVVIEVLRPATELADLEALVAEANWNQSAADWRTFLDLGTVYAVRAADRGPAAAADGGAAGGRIIATAATLPYGGRFAWISMVLVAVAFRRRGLASRLMRRCIDDLKTAALVPILDATPAGRAVYSRLGFADSWTYRRLETRERAPSFAPLRPDGTTVRPIADADWPRLCAYDAAAFGAERPLLLARLKQRLPGAALVAERGGRLVGFLLGRDGRTAAQFGPLIAEDDAAACALLAGGLGAVSGPLYVDLADAKPQVGDWVAASGFAVQRPFTRMVLGSPTRFDDGRRTFAVAGPELG